MGWILCGRWNLTLKGSANSQKLLPFLQDQPSARREIKNLTYDWGYANMQLGQGYCTPHGAVIDEYITVLEG
jgi:hypothetical protein